jgi:hypothetical protein
MGRGVRKELVGGVGLRADLILVCASRICADALRGGAARALEDGVLEQRAVQWTLELAREVDRQVAIARESVEGVGE